MSATLIPVTKYLVDDHGPDGHQYFPGRTTMGTNWSEVITGQGDDRHEAFEDALDQLAEAGYDADQIPPYRQHSFDGSGKLTIEQANDPEFSYYLCIFVR